MMSGRRPQVGRADGCTLGPSTSWCFAYTLTYRLYRHVAFNDPVTAAADARCATLCHHLPAPGPCSLDIHCCRALLQSLCTGLHIVHAATRCHLPSLLACARAALSLRTERDVV